MSKSQNFLRKIFLQKKLIQNAQPYPYTYIFQYNNISGNDWKKIKNIIHNVQNLKKMNLQVIPSKLRRPLNNNTNSALYFSKIKGSCCILNCYTPQDLEIFYKIIYQSLDKKELNGQLSTGINSFIHLALQVNSLESNSSNSIASSTNNTFNVEATKLNIFLNPLEIKKRLTLTFASTYGNFFNTLHTKTTQIISIPEVLNQRILFIAGKSSTN